VVEVSTTSQFVCAALSNFNSNVLPSISCGKFVPVNVMLSFPSKLIPRVIPLSTVLAAEVSGTAEAIVQSTLDFVRSAYIGTLPKKVVTNGSQSPQTGSLSNKHSILVPLREPSSPAP
jgi:hypothetical protein